MDPSDGVSSIDPASPVWRGSREPRRIGRRGPRPQRRPTARGPKWRSCRPFRRTWRIVTVSLPLRLATVKKYAVDAGRMAAGGRRAGRNLAAATSILADRREQSRRRRRAARAESCSLGNAVSSKRFQSVVRGFTQRGYRTEPGRAIDLITGFLEDCFNQA